MKHGCALTWTVGAIALPGLIYIIVKFIGG